MADIGFTDNSTSYIPGDPYPVTYLTSNNTQYEYVRRYTTGNGPADIGSIATGKIVVLGTQYEPSNYISVDVQISVASSISKNVTTGDTIPDKYTSYYSRPKMWRSGGLFDVDAYEKAYHFRALPFQETPISQNSIILNPIATFVGAEKKRIYLNNTSGIVVTDFFFNSSYIPTSTNNARIVGLGSTYIDINVEHSFVGIATTSLSTIKRIKNSTLDTEFGFYFNKNVVFPERSFGFYYGDDDPGITITPPTHDTWGVFIETEQDPIGNDREVWNFFADLVLIADHESIGVGTATEPEPILQVLDGPSEKKGVYIENTTGIGIRPDERYRLYVEDTNDSESCIEACRFAGVTHVTDTRNAINILDAALIVDGGTSIAKKLRVYEDVDSGSSGSGSVIVQGGVGISKKLFTGDKLTVESNGYDVTGNSKITGNLQVTGTITGTTTGNKLSSAFDIPHTKEKGKRIRHIITEGPEAGIYIRGKLKDSNVIELPEYWDGLVDPETITVTLTQIGYSQDLIVDKIESDKKVIVRSGVGANINCYYEVWAARWLNPMNHEEKLHVVYDGETPDDYPGGNANFLIGGWDYDRRNPQWET
jgi:hypothetical protein